MPSKDHILLIKTPPTQAFTEYTTAPEMPVPHLPLFPEIFVFGNDRAGPKPQVMVGASAGVTRAEIERLRTPKLSATFVDLCRGDMFCEMTFKLGPSEKGSIFCIGRPLCLWLNRSRFELEPVCHDRPNRLKLVKGFCSRLAISASDLFTSCAFSGTDMVRIINRLIAIVRNDDRCLLLLFTSRCPPLCRPTVYA